MRGNNVIILHPRKRYLIKGKNVSMQRKGLSRRRNKKQSKMEYKQCKTK